MKPPPPPPPPPTKKTVLWSCARGGQDNVRHGETDGRPGVGLRTSRLGIVWNLCRLCMLYILLPVALVSLCTGLESCFAESCLPSSSFYLGCTWDFCLSVSISVSLCLSLSVCSVCHTHTHTHPPIHTHTLVY